MEIPFLNFKKLVILKNFFKKVPWFLGRHAFVFILLLLFFAIIIGGGVFYNYVLILENKDIGVVENSLKFRKDIYKKILERWLSNELKIQQSIQEDYLSPFVQ